MQGQIPLGGFGDVDPGELHRLFFALWPHDAVRDGIAAAAAALRQAHAPRGRWINPGRYHLTLQFLGDSDRLREDVAAAAMRAAASVQARPFDLVLDAAGSFRNRNVPWWLGCVATPPELQALWTALGGALAHAGVRAESGKALVPHVTVLRDAHAALPRTSIVPVTWTVRDFVLVHSVLGRQSAYHLLGRWPLSPSLGLPHAEP